MACRDHLDMHMMCLTALQRLSLHYITSYVIISGQMEPYLPRLESSKKVCPVRCYVDACLVGLYTARQKACHAVQ